MKRMAISNWISSVFLSLRVWLGGGHVGNWGDHLHPAVWIPSLQEPRSGSRGAL